MKNCSDAFKSIMEFENRKELALNELKLQKMQHIVGKITKEEYDAVKSFLMQFTD